VPAKVVISEKFKVNVMTMKFFETHKLKCSFYGNSPLNLDGHKFSAMLETLIEKNGNMIPVTFYFSDEIKEEKCFIIPHVAKKLTQK
jgi:hypothetical protein